ncbi:MAG: DUF1501 domain-containing protein [Alphaproteobacteria bacterium]|nr:DUF1501 domain-containing protein [Alphaproteobacteria bacterium]
MVSRRRVLRGLGSGGLITALPGAIPVALAGAPTDRRLVVLLLRGGLDGLAAVPPYGDRDYHTLRGALAFADPGRDNGALDLDGRFGLHPSLLPLEKMFRARELAVLHAVATPYRARSHFEGQDLLESGAALPRGVQDGWLNRALGLFGEFERRLGLAVGHAVPLILRGDVPVGAWAPRVLPPLQDDFLSRLQTLYAGDPVLAPALGEAIQAQDMSDEIMGQGDRRKRPRGARVLRHVVKNVGRLLANPRGPRIAVLEAGGWDTHAQQGVLTGRLARNLGALADGLVALRAAMEPVWNRTAVVVVSEFGRTVRPNGTGGTDHGTAGVAFLLGGSVAGGRVVARWPGLSTGRLYENRDLAPTTDMRALFKAVLVDHLGLPARAVDDRVFPGGGNAARLRGLMQS